MKKVGYLYRWKDGTDSDFVKFSVAMENYYNRLVGGAQNRKDFIPYNHLADIHNVLMVYDGGKPVACGSFKEYNRGVAEIKRIWVSPDYRGRHISKEIMARLEGKARELGYRRLILQTREACMEAVALYEAAGYERIPNYPPYNEMQLAVCYAKEIAPSCPCEGQDGSMA